MLNFKIGDKVSLNNDKNIYKIQNIICETSGSMNCGHINTYFGTLENLSNGEIITTVIGIIELLTNKEDIYVSLLPS